MRILSVAICIASLAHSSLPSDDEIVLKVAQKAEVVVVAEVIEVQLSPGAWSGVFAWVQHVRYKVVEVLKGSADNEGEVKSGEIDVGHYLVFNSLTADKEQARLSPKLFKPGNRLLLMLSQEEGHGCRLRIPHWDIATFCSPNENYGAMLADPKLVDKVRRATAAK
jgi:hypothetical protein